MSWWKVSLADILSRPLDQLTKRICLKEKRGLCIQRRPVAATEAKISPYKICTAQKLRSEPDLWAKMSLFIRLAPTHTPFLPSPKSRSTLWGHKAKVYLILLFVKRPVWRRLYYFCSVLRWSRAVAEMQQVCCTQNITFLNISCFNSWHRLQLHVLSSECSLTGLDLARYKAIELIMINSGQGLDTYYGIRVFRLKWVTLIWSGCRKVSLNTPLCSNFLK